MNDFDYLAIPEDYGQALDGLRWAPGCDALEFANPVTHLTVEPFRSKVVIASNRRSPAKVAALGTPNDPRLLIQPPNGVEFLTGTLMVVEQLEQVLEGLFTTVPRVPHFAHVLHLLKLTISGGSPPQLNAAYRRAHSPGASRNLGVLIGALCRTLPQVAAPPPWQAIRLALKRRLLFPEPPDARRTERPPLGPTDFEHCIIKVLRDYDDETLVHWLRHGCGPSDKPGKKLADEICEPPRRVQSLAAIVRNRPRLSAAVALMPILDAALSLPPRRLRTAERPMGGYAGVTSRGEPERLLPSQFALDSLDFIRRFAENELLYFRREEPHRGEKPLRLVILDQGVRTWGGVRLALAAAVLALANKDRRRAGELRLAVTSSDRPPFDPSELTDDQIAELLEASDLTRHPAKRLADALTASHKLGPRDVLLLTHPRSATETAVHDAARQRGPDDRLFVLTVHDDGRAELAEWRGAGVVPVRSFRVNLVHDEPPPAQVKFRPVGTSATLWTGDIEPIGYPFRPGLLGTPQYLGFDATSDRVMVVGPHGVLHVASVFGSPPEIFPRAASDGGILTMVDAVLGVSNGFVVCGRMTPAASELELGTYHVAAHYDCARRHVRLHRFHSIVGSTGVWQAFPKLNCIVFRHNHGGAALDLETNGRHPGTKPQFELIARARQAWAMSEESPHEISIAVLAPLVNTSAMRMPWVKAGGGVVWVGGVTPPWPPFIPMAEGRRLFDAINLPTRADLGGSTLALRAGEHDKSQRVYLFQGPNGRMLGDYELKKPNFLHQLSPDGQWLAWQTAGTKVEVVSLTDGRSSFPCFVRASVHNSLNFRLRETLLVIGVGPNVHSFSLSGAEPFHLLVSTDSPLMPNAGAIERLPKVAAYDPKRFRSVIRKDGWTALMDLWGQVVLLNHRQELVAHFMVRRRLAAVALPDGTCWGAQSLLGVPETPGAVAKIGRALQAAREGV